MQKIASPNNAHPSRCRKDLIRCNYNSWTRTTKARHKEVTFSNKTHKPPLSVGFMQIKTPRYRQRASQQSIQTSMLSRTFHHPVDYILKYCSFSLPLRISFNTILLIIFRNNALLHFHYEYPLYVNSNLALNSFLCIFLDMRNPFLNIRI